MRYRLRTLMILLALGPPGLAVVWWSSKPNDEWRGNKGELCAGNFTQRRSENLLYRRGRSAAAPKGAGIAAT